MRSGPLRDPHPGRGQGQAEGDRPRPERLGRDPVRRAARRRGAQQHLDPGRAWTRRARRSASSTSCLGRSRRAPSRCSLRWRRWRAPTCGWRGPAWRRSWTPSRPAAADDAAELLSARHPLLGQGAVPIDLRTGRALRLSGAGGHRAEHRRQDGLAQDAGPAGAHAPGRPAGACRRWRAAAGLRPRDGRHRRRAEHRPVALHLLQPPAQRGALRGGSGTRHAGAAGRGRAPAPIPRKAPRWPWPWSSGCSSRARGWRPPPTTRSSRRSPRSTRWSAMPRSPSTWPRCSRPTGSRSGCRASHRPSPSRSAWACLSRSWTTLARGWRPST